MTTRRNDILLAGIKKTDAVIEIGPLHSGIATKRDGWNVTIVDHASQAALMAKYAKDPSVNIDLIEHVDVIWRGGPLCEVFDAASHGTYRGLVASHVIEHIPDIIGFLDSAARLLDPVEGVLSLAVPDKRWCFDVFRPLSSTGEALEAHRRRLQVHAADRLFDQAAHTVTAGGSAAWGREPLRQLCLTGSLETAKSWFDAWTDAAEAPYVDCHAWQFTPSSFELMMLELGAVGAVDWRIDWLEPQSGAECICQLLRGKPAFPSVEARDARRLELLAATALEVSEIADRLPILESASTRRLPLAPKTRTDVLEERLATLTEELRPITGVMQHLLPLRRMLARLRRRI
jgi:hypothetical protein